MNFVNNADPAEGVLFPQTGLATHHSTFFSQKATTPVDDGSSYFSTASGKDINAKGYNKKVVSLTEEALNGYSAPPMPVYKPEQTEEVEDLSEVALNSPVEKVHSLESIAYQHRANSNSPGPRTTFYDKTNGLWRQEAEI